jgi:FkbH-like protein
MKSDSALLGRTGEAIAFTRTEPRDSRLRLRGCLLKHQRPISRSIWDLMIQNEGFASKQRDISQNVDEYSYRICQVFVDCLVLYFETMDETYREILIGEIIKLAHVPRNDLEDLVASRRLAADAVIQSVLGHCRKELGSAELEALECLLESIGQVVKKPASTRVEVLLIGDCLFLDVASFLCGSFLNEGIEFNPTFVQSRNPAESQRMIREQATEKWLAVAYSPFTYEFDDLYARSLRAPHGIARPHAVRDLVEPSMERIARHLELIANEIDRPVFVHNSTNVRRHNWTAADAFKTAMSWQTRRLVRCEANRRIVECIEKANTDTFPHVHLFDEHALLGAYTEWALGARYYDAEDRHPAVLSRLIAGKYRDLFETLRTLSTKKLIVCDLDNTLWQGEIGEGEVRHYRDRQATLKRLREKGILLAINSRNDPKNVHWRGAVLNEGDFVASEINWDAKSTNMMRIQQKLNLKAKDFVFIDDRGDQREIVCSMFPEIHAMDALSERTWNLMDVWAGLAHVGDDGDRTQLYREREEREAFLQGTPADQDASSFLSRLGLKAAIRPAVRGDLKRIVELINRTNQFNLNASRTSFREATSWIASSHRRILVIEGADKFGQMGLICAAFVEFGPTATRIPVFVLSCRVFGYGFEKAMLNAIHRLNESLRNDGAPKAIVGLFQETQFNGPCHAMYPDHGFRKGKGEWIIDEWKSHEDPVWLDVRDLVAS